ncbi:hypothetical protein GGD66_006562 [Bradyrhizobium sp. CIR48]|nr:hypothetical protein [Bradyrhizobium sp. CIR48]
MSAANLIVASDGAHLVSDALVWNTADQTITAICNRAILLPQFRAAATVRAEAFVVFQAVGLALSTMTAGGFAEFKQTVGPTLMELNDRMDAMGAASPFEVSVAGISEQHGPSGFRITSLEAGSEHLEPWRAFEFPRGFSPCPSNTEADEQKIRSALATAPAKLEGHAITVLETQRDIAGRDYVAASGISTRIIHRWHEDVVGPATGRTRLDCPPTIHRQSQVENRWQMAPIEQQGIYIDGTFRAVRRQRAMAERRPRHARSARGVRISPARPVWPIRSARAFGRRRMAIQPSGRKALRPTMMVRLSPSMSTRSAAVARW